MDPAEFKKLLFRGESETLEFKADNYSLDNDDEKGELLKDLLAFVNAWRETDAHILLGVQGMSGGIAQVAGITKDRDDNELQTLVSGKIKPPIRFSYETLEYEGKRCGVIHIPVQKRPAFVAKDYGKLRANTVFIRRGSRTDIAQPDEVAQMGSLVAKAIGPRFVVYAQPRIEGPKTFQPSFGLGAWLENEGGTTAHDLMVEIIRESHSNRGFGGSWNYASSATAQSRYLHKIPVHPKDKITLPWWPLEEAEFETRGLEPTGRVIRYLGTPFEFSLRVLARDQQPTVINVQFSNDEIKSLVMKSFGPTK